MSRAPRPLPREDVVTPELKAALREAFISASHGEAANCDPRVSFERLVEELRFNLRRRDALGMDWRGRA